MRIVKKILSQIPLYVVFILFSSIVVGWLFGFATDTSKEKKIVLFADVQSMDETALSVKLEEHKPDGIRMIRAHVFGYAVFDSTLLENADVYIVTASEAEKYRESFLKITDAALAARFYRGYDGMKVYDAATGEGILKDYVTYANEDHYLFFGAKSVHTGGEGSVDSHAFDVVDELIKI